MPSSEMDYNEEDLHKCEASRIACVYIPHRKALSSSFRIEDWYEWTIFTEYNHHEQNGNWNINSRVIQRRWQRFTCIQESIRQGGLESDVTHGQRSPHRVVEGVPGVVRVQLVLRGFEERQYVLPTPTSISFEMRTIFWRLPLITKSRY